MDSLEFFGNLGAVIGGLLLALVFCCGAAAVIGLAVKTFIWVVW